LTLISSVGGQTNDKYQPTLHDVITFLSAIVRKAIRTTLL